MGRLRQGVSRCLLDGHSRHQLLSVLCSRIWSQINIGVRFPKTCLVHSRDGVHTSSRPGTGGKKRADRSTAATTKGGGGGGGDNDEWWSQTMPYQMAADLVEKYDCKRPAGSKEERSTALGRGMPSTVMRGLDMMFYSDIKRRRLRQGLRARVLATLSDLRLLIHSTDGVEDRTGRVFWYLERLNRLYLDALGAHAPELSLRGGTSVNLGQVSVAIGSSTQPQKLVRRTKYYARSDMPSFDRRDYEKAHPPRKGQATMTVDPVAPCWTDYLVADLTEAEAHGLFALVARSKVPDGTLTRLRPAIEEALAFAYNRRGLALDTLESMRVCMYFLRHQGSGVQTRQLQRLWLHAGRALVAERTRDGDSKIDIGDTDGPEFDLRFKRWNNVASQLLTVLVHGETGVADAWTALAQWHAAWTRVMQRLCPEPRRGHADGLSFPYWRPKRAGRVRLHELTLDVQAINVLLAALIRDGHGQRAVELLGLATSEAGVRLTASIFNVVLRGLAMPSLSPTARSYALPSLAALPLLANARAPTAYALPEGLENQPGAHMALIMRAMERWRVAPDARTLEIVAAMCCRRADADALCTTLRLFASQWGIVPSERCWQAIRTHAMHDAVHAYFVRHVEPVLGKKTRC